MCGPSLAAYEGAILEMNKQELIGHVADRAGLSRNDASRAVETMLETITLALKRGDEVRLVGFGNFSRHFSTNLGERAAISVHKGSTELNCS